MRTGADLPLGACPTHRSLIAADLAGRISHVSVNLGDHCKVAPNAALGLPLSEAFDPVTAGRLQNVIPPLEAGYMQSELWKRDPEPTWFGAHQNEGKYIFEWERSLSFAGPYREAGPILTLELSKLTGIPHIQGLAQTAAELAARITGFDRVMVYRFLPDWSGEVIAEVPQSWDEPFWGLRYRCHGDRLHHGERQSLGIDCMPSSGTISN